MLETLKKSRLESVLEDIYYPDGVFDPVLTNIARIHVYFGLSIIKNILSVNAADQAGD